MDEVRSRNMRAIRGKHTKPEFMVRSMLHRAGFRYRLHPTDLPGKPDLVIRKYKLAIFVQGCFWHWHGCDFFRIPKTRTDWWVEKLSQNRNRDERTLSVLLSMGWHVLWIWECYLKKHKNAGTDGILETISSLIETKNVKNNTRFVEFPSRQSD